MGAPSWSGAATAPAISEQPLVAVALVDADRVVHRATALFLDCCGSADAFLGAFEREIASVLGGDVDQATARLDRTTLDISAILDQDGARCALLTIARPADHGSKNGGIPLLEQAIDASPAVVWVKDLGGRYLRVNGKYVEQLQVAAEHVCGKTEGELTAGESIEGLRWRDGAKPPLELEYTVDATHRLPAFAVLRFALRDPEGKPLSVCGVAAPLARAGVARSECERLMRLERWTRSDEAAVRAEVIAEWGLAGVNESDEAQADPVAAGPAPAPADGDADHFAAMAAELDAALETSARLDRELAEERRQVMVLREASALAARRAHELLRTVTAERTRVAELEESVTQAEARATELEGERDTERARAEELEKASGRAHEAKLAAEKTQAELAKATAALAREQRAVEGLRAELRAAEEEVERVRNAATEAVAQAPTQDELEEERRRADRATAALAAARARSEMAEAEAKSALAQARAELRRANEEAAATTEALNAEKQRSGSLGSEVAELRDEVTRERDRAEQAVAAGEQARREASQLADRIQELEQAQKGESAAAATAEKRTVEKLRRELAAVRDELARSKQAVAQRPSPEELEQERARAEEAEAAAEQAEAAGAEARAEALALSERVTELERAQKGMSATAATADKRAADRMRRELAEVRDELARAKQAVAQRPSPEELEQERARAEEAEAAAEQAEAAGAEARAEAVALAERVAELERAQRGKAAAGSAADKRPIEKLQRELGEARGKLEQERARAERLEGELAALEGEVARLEGEVARLEGEAATLEGEVATLEAAASERDPEPAAMPEPEPPTPEPASERAPDPDAAEGSPAWAPAAQRALAAALAETADWRTALKQSVKIIGVEGEWDAVAAWCPDGRHGFMKCAASWAGQAISSHTFETQIWQHRQKTPAGLDRSPKAVVELGSAQDALLKAAAEEGMGSAVFVPVSDGTQLVAMLQLLSRHADPPPAELMVSLESIGLQLAAIARLLTTASTPQWRVGRL